MLINKTKGLYISLSLYDIGEKENEQNKQNQGFENHKKRSSNNSAILVQGRRKIRSKNWHEVSNDRTTITHHLFGAEHEVN